MKGKRETKRIIALNIVLVSNVYDSSNLGIFWPYLNYRAPLAVQLSSFTLHEE